MKTSWLYDSEVSLLHQIYLMLRTEILDGLYLGRDDFPGEIELAERFRVSVATSRGVLQRLAREGLIARGRGRRTQVLFSPPARSKSEPSAPVFPDAESPFSYVLLEVAIRVAPWEACHAFDLPPGTELWQCTRLRRLGKNPHSVSISVQPVDIGQRHREADLNRLSMTKLLAKAGLPVVNLVRRYSVAIPPPDLTVHLGTKVHEPSLLATVLQHAAKDRLVEWSRHFFRQDQPGPWARLNLEAGQSPRDPRTY
jgi:GntR family transcriptional regulator